MDGEDNPKARFKILKDLGNESLIFFFSFRGCILLLQEVPDPWGKLHAPGGRGVGFSVAIYPIYPVSRC